MMQNKKDLSNILDSIRSWSLQWDIESLLQEIVKDTTTTFSANFGSILLLEQDGLKQRAKWPLKGFYQNIDFQLSISDEVIRHGNAIYAHNLIHTNNENAQAYCIPLTANRGILGVIYLEVFDKQSEITKKERLSLEMLGVQAASYLENSMLYHAAITDPLTGLFSHRHFQTEIEAQIKRSKRDKTKLTLLIMDLDNFKKLNDQFGHAEGNKCLIKISQLLREHFRSSDIIARFGGDEFEILLPDANSMDALEASKKLIDAILKKKFPLKISATIGISTYPDNALDSQALFLTADQALYKGKEQGKCCAVQSTQTEQKVTNSKDTSTLNTLTTSSSKGNTIDIQSFSSHIAHKIDGQEVMGRIASSSNGEVLLVKQNDLNRTVALKQPLTSNLSDHQLNAFKKEALITASLNHPGVIPLYSMGTGIDGRAYYTMKSLEGKSLEKIFKIIKADDNAFDEKHTIKKLCNILLKTAETIAYAHNHNVAHLDIHPGNIIVGDFGEITLIDWGKGIFLNKNDISDPPTQDKRENYVSGLPNYKAPEFFKHNGAPGTQSDIYSLGIILFEILTRFRPFEKTTIKKTIDAIIDESPITHEELEHHYSVDPLLSNLIHQSLIKDPAKRITADEFISDLSRYVLQEKNILTHVFHTKKDPIKKEDWQVHIKGEWELNDGVWCSKAEGENILLWKKPVTSDLSFTCEAWIDREGQEISLICGSNPPLSEHKYDSNQKNYQGYYLQLGADNNMFTKVSRHAIDIFSVDEYIPEVNKKYMITISYIENWLYCYINDKMIFSYKEIHPSQGYHIGLYSWGSGVHFRPIKIEYQKMGLTIPTINLADEHYAYNRFDSAIDQYEEIIHNFPDRLEAIDAKLKLGICYAKTGDTKKSEAIFHSLKNTFLEPYALSELAAMEFPSEKRMLKEHDGDYEKAYNLFSTIMEKFPNSQAKFNLLSHCLFVSHIYDNNFKVRKIPLNKSIQLKIQLFTLASKTLSPPCKTQVRMMLLSIRHYLYLGDFKQADEITKIIIKKYMRFIESDNQILSTCINISLAMKRDHSHLNSQLNYHKISPVEIHPLAFLEHYNSKDNLKKFITSQSSLLWASFTVNILFHLYTQKNLKISSWVKPIKERNKKIKTTFRKDMDADFHSIEMILSLRTHDYFDDLKEHVFSNFRGFDPKSTTNYYSTVKHIFDFEFTKASKLLIKENFSDFDYLDLHQRLLLMICLLNSFNLDIPITLKELKEKVEFYLTGYSLELAQNMLNNTAFEFSALWSKRPYQCYFERVIYAIWLMHKQEWKLLVMVIDIIEYKEYGDAAFQQLIQEIKSKIPANFLN